MNKGTIFLKNIGIVVYDYLQAESKYVLLPVITSGDALLLMEITSSSSVPLKMTMGCRP